MSPLFDGVTKAKLRDEEWLGEEILKLGISDAPSYEDYEYQDVGMGIWQTPQEMAPHLIALSRRKIRTYAEIGMWYGGGFMVTVEYLARFGLEAALGIDVDIKPQVREYADCAPVPTTLLEAPSTSPAVKDVLEAMEPDLVFIDGDHSQPAVQQDWELAASCARYVAFHDLSEPDVWETWDSIPGRKKAWHLGPGTGLVRVR